MLALCAIAGPSLAQQASGHVQGSDAQAQQAASPAAKSGDNSNNLIEVVITGVGTAGGLKKFDAAYSVTSLSQAQITQANVTAFADILKSSPGVYIETSGGPTGANVEVTGFPGSSGAPYTTVELNGASVFPMSGQAYMEPTTLFRLDDSIQRLELVQGGPGVLYGNGQPGLTANYILKQGTDTLTGDFGVTYGSEGMGRIDGFVGGPLSAKNELYGSIGGFWTTSDNGVRDPQFDAKGGGQLTATLTRKWSDASLLIYGRYLKYDAEFETDTPIYNPAPGKFSAYPSFNPLTGTMESRADQYEPLQVAPCTGSGCAPGTVAVNMANGRGPDMFTVGGEFKKNFADGLQLLDDVSYSNGTTHMVAFYSAGNPETLSTYIASAEAADTQLPSGLTASAYYTNTGAAASLGQNVLTQDLRYVAESFRSASNEIHLSYDVVPGNTVTVGNYTTLYRANELVYNGADMLLQAQSNPAPIGINLTNGVNTWQLSSPEGFVTSSSSATHIMSTGVNTAFFLTDRWKFNQFLLDAGVRAEHEAFNDNYQNTASGSLSGNPDELYNLTAQYFVPGTQRVGYSKSGVSWTAGLNYEIDPRMSVYVRANEGVHFAAFSDVTAANISHFPLQSARNYQVGYRYQNEFLYVDLSAFDRIFSGVSTNGPFVINGAPQTVFFSYGSKTTGLEYQINLKPFQWLSEPFQRFTLAATGDYARGTYDNSSGCVIATSINNTTTTVCNAGLDYDGSLLARQPIFQTRVTPAYTLPTPSGFIKAWATYEYVGKHYGDQQEQQYLGSYYDLSFGVTGDVGSHWEWTVRGTNVTNQLGVTEGNARTLIGPATVNGVILARAIEGREINAQLKYLF